MALQGLAVAPESGGEDYYRKAFGASWADVDANGCSTREDTLRRDLVDVVVDTDGCTVQSGTLHDPYSGTTLTFTRGRETSRLVPIDHRVPLAEAYASGASTWTAGQRLQFANDPANLQATSEAENSAKSDRDPAEWMPSDPAAACGYVTAYVQVKTTWRLSVDSAEADALNDLLTTC